MAEKNKPVPLFSKEKKFTASVGGSVLFGELEECDATSLVELDRVFVSGMLDFLRNLAEEDYTTAIIVGGGAVARVRVDDARSFGGEHDVDDRQLDYIGIGVSETNSAALLAVLLRNGIPAERLSKSKLKNKEDKLEPGKIYIRGGTEPGLSTDYVAVEAAIKTGAKVVVNISNTPGLFALTPAGELDRSQLIKQLPLTEYLEKFAVEHRPGVNTPFDLKAAQLAQENGITLILVSKDLANLEKLKAGQDFIGTVLN